MVALKRSIMINSLTGLCVTKLDVLDGLDEIKLCTAYELHGKRIHTLPTQSELLAECKPIYDTLPGWKESTANITVFAELPKAAQKYLLHVEELAGIPIDIISTGPDRADTIILRHPFCEENGFTRTIVAEERT